MLRLLCWALDRLPFGDLRRLVLLLLVLLAACARKTMPTPEKTQEPVVAASAQVEPPPTSADLPVVPVAPIVPEPANSVLLAAIACTPCFGSCPVFEAQVWADGHAIWTGEKNVARLGLYRATIPPHWLDDLMKYADKSTYFDLAARYPLSGRNIPDLPLTVCYLRKGAFEKSISNGGDAPLALRQFERRFAEKLEELSWEKVDK